VALVSSLEAVVKSERARIVSGLYRQCGSLDRAEDAFHEALTTAVATWPRQGTPANPAAWLTTVAGNHLKQAHRHAQVTEAKAAVLREDEALAPRDPEAVADDQLRLIFTCCHPELGSEAQVALTLKVIAGLSVEQLARAFLVPEPTMAQRLVRAKKLIEDRGLGVSTPGRTELPARLTAVLAVLYLMFNEGHASTDVDLQVEALRLATLLAELLPTEPEVFGLQALICFSVARVKTRAQRLADQDRTQWNAPLIVEGLVALGRAQRLGGGAYTLQAELASHHATAPAWADTDWSRIIATYDRLLALTPSPVIELNRAIAIAMRDGAEAGLALLRPLEPQLRDYPPFRLTRAELEQTAAAAASSSAPTHSTATSPRSRTPG